jgi:hypothetical protein
LANGWNFQVQNYAGANSGLKSKSFKLRRKRSLEGRNDFHDTPRAAHSMTASAAQCHSLEKMVLVLELRDSTA